MSRTEKAKDRLKSVPKDYTFTKSENLVNSLGFERYNKGKTSGLRVMFIRKSDKLSILLHKPNSGNESLCGKKLIKLFNRSRGGVRKLLPCG